VETTKENRKFDEKNRGIAHQENLFVRPYNREKLHLGSNQLSPDGFNGKRISDGGVGCFFKLWCGVEIEGKN
jgi:hypothetical protein